MALVKIRNANNDGWVIVGGGNEVIQQDAEPATTYPGQLWLDTDGEHSPLTSIEDNDGDTKVQCEASADEDRIRMDIAGVETVKVIPSGIVIYGVQDGHATLRLQADQGDDNSDIWHMRAEADGDFILQTYASGSYATVLHSTPDGEVTKPLQPFFHANIENANTSMPTAGETTRINFDRVVFEDGGSNYDTTNRYYVAPVSGTYLLTTSVRLNDMDRVCTYMRITFVTSNTTFYKYYSPTHEGTEDVYGIIHFTIMCQLDESDTVYVQYTQSGGSAQVDTVAGNNYSYFMGYLMG
jgi:hypothetical protein